MHKLSDFAKLYNCLAVIQMKYKLHLPHEMDRKLKRHYFQTEILIGFLCQYWHLKLLTFPPRSSSLS